MDSSTREVKVVRFGVFEADLVNRELRKAGVRLKVQEQPFQILMMLLERPGEIVSREDLRKRLWPENTFVSFDVGLNSAMKKLRQARGDPPGSPRFVETLYRRGYRFLAPVERMNGSGARAMAAGAAAKLGADEELWDAASERECGGQD